jgi:hypothetical protein
MNGGELLNRNTYERVRQTANGETSITLYKKTWKRTGKAKKLSDADQARIAAEVSAGMKICEIVKKYNTTRYLANRYKDLGAGLVS